MNTITRLMLCAALFAGLSACGNKGPLVQAEAPEAQESDTTPAPATTEPATPPATEPDAPVDPVTQPAVDEDEPAPADPVDPPPPADDGTP